MIGFNLVSNKKEISKRIEHCRCTGGKELNLSDLKLTEFPESLGGLSSLEEIYISGNITALPESIGNLSSLTKLYLYETKIKTLPSTIGNLSKLKELCLMRCLKFESLPDSIGNLRSLERLCIRGGKIAALPESIGNIISLTSLELQHTSLLNLPESIGNLVNLKSLGVYNISEDLLYWDYFNGYRPLEYDKIPKKRSPFYGLPDSASKLTSLLYLHLSNTEVTNLPDYLGNLPALKTLDIIRCNIKTIPPSLQKLADSGKLRIMRSIEDLEL